LKVTVYTARLDVIELTADEVVVSDPAKILVVVDGAEYKYDTPILVKVEAEKK